MNNYTDLATSLAYRSRSVQPRPDLVGIKNFLGTSAGRSALRSVIDSIVMNNRVMGGQARDPNQASTHEAIIQSLAALMQNRATQ